MADDPKPPISANRSKNPRTGSLLVRGPHEGRWRAGMHFTPAELELPLASLEDEQIEAIEADPQLSVKRTGG